MIKWAKVNPNAVIPTRKDENAGYDIYACFDGDLMVLPSGSITMVHTGIASSFESDKYFQIQERGSTGSIGLKYCAGVIDSGFRGEWVIILYNANPKDIIISKLSKEELYERDEDIANAIIYPYTKGIAQAVLLPVIKEEQVEVTYEELLKIPSDRGTGMLGSSGK